MNLRPHLTALLLGVAVGSACSLYVPTVRDCSLECSDEGVCPAGTTCNEGFCRPEGFSGACDCNVGDTEACGATKGECRVGQRICLDSRIWGPCLGEVKPTFELCDGKDNDCDGIIDEEVANAPVCPLVQGVCERKTQQCLDAGFVNTCTASSYGPTYEVLEQSCDGLDNDCDGNVDSRPAVRLKTGVDQFTVEAVPGGYFLFWSVSGDHFIYVQQYNDLLQPQGAVASVDVGDRVDSFLGHASNAGTVVVSFLRKNNVAGFIRLSTSATVPMLIDSPLPSVSKDWAVSVLASGNVRGVYENDGGVFIAQWDLTTAAVTVTPRTLRQPTTEVRSLSLTNDGTVLAWDGTFDDGGTSDSVGGVESIEGTSLSTRKTGASYGSLIATPGRLQSFGTYSNYFTIIFPIVINESGVKYCSDLSAVADTCLTVAMANDYAKYRDGAGARVGDDMVVGWRDNGTLVVGTALPTVQQVRSRTLTSTGSVAQFELAGPVGSNFLTVFYVPLGEPTSVFAVLLCPP